ncbi:cytochrome c oxidase assembly protein [Bacillus shivajii]|uniref:cytochrome c oxidase assembly protein n=1 Tax=Bacillus shivajii TaxID=1983719 RepID=UPI001CFA93F7|nr:cytochrome c oxidase assembly protein [Bacillus shivajii]UCZ54942.1 cytochrome c oxidase assembly protein [Bacillus shivajii]
MSHEHHIESGFLHDVAGPIPQIVLGLPFLIGIILYIIAVVSSNRDKTRWPFYRTLFWGVGSLCAIAAVTGPLAVEAHHDFSVHMLGHLLLGMLAPLLMVLAAPMTLALRTLSVTNARRLAKVLKSSYIRFVTDPVVASVLNIGGLWLLYTTGLYEAMHDYMLLHIFVHLHVFLAGYAFTVAMVDIDPKSSRPNYMYRAVTFVFALAGHGILSKFIYAYPPAGVPAAQAEAGGMLMYYGGDAIDMILIFILCHQWYRATRPRIAYGQPM